MLAGPGGGGLGELLQPVCCEKKVAFWGLFGGKLSAHVCNTRSRYAAMEEKKACDKREATSAHLTSSLLNFSQHVGEHEALPALQERVREWNSNVYPMETEEVSSSSASFAAGVLELPIVPLTLRLLIFFLLQEHLTLPIHGV